MKILKQLLFAVVLVIGISITASAQENQKKPPPKEPPPKIVPREKPKEDKPKDERNNDNKTKKPATIFFKFYE